MAVNNVEEGVVIFAGAGCSMAPPSSLPNWKELNDAILDTLWDRLEPYGLKMGFREKIITAIKNKRDEDSFPPDYQAQLMVERAGIKYFELLSAVDSDSYNAVQYYSAVLAKAGMLRALVTTNFDKNFERAFSETGVSYQSFFDEEGFNSIIFGNKKNGTIPIIKIHGCCSSPNSMVDTRKQRLKGRAKALQDALFKLLQYHQFIFAGFSGQDFDDNKNYLGMRDAAPSSRGFTYLCLPGSTVRKSMNELINFYDENKACSIVCDPVHYLEELLKNSGIPFESFVPAKADQLSIRGKLKIKIASIEPMDAVNMLTALAESYGDEISARYIYDEVWRNRFHKDYNSDAMHRFLLNHGRSYAINFQNDEERAINAGVLFKSFGDKTNSAKKNLKHQKNSSPETIGLIALVQAFNANPILFAEFPHSLTKELRVPISNITEGADIVYYYSFYATTYGIPEGLKFLQSAISEMKTACDEPRMSQLLSRKAILQSKTNLFAAAQKDALAARKLAKKYHEPHLLALSALALAICARKKEDFDSAFKFIREAEKNYSDLKRIPQYIESIVEYLKIISLGLEKDAFDKATLLQIVSDIKNKVESYIVERVNVFEPEYCYLMGMILGHYSNAEKGEVLQWFADSISLAEQFTQEKNYHYYRETCNQLGILTDVENLINEAKTNSQN